MHRLRTRLIAGFLILLVMVVAIGLYSSIAGQRSLQDSIGQSSVFVANEILVNLNMQTYFWLDRLEVRAIDRDILSAVAASNRELAATGAVDATMERMDASWTAAAKGEPSPAVRRLLENPVADELRAIYHAHFELKQGSPAIVSIAVVNAYGATVAATDLAAGYRHDREALWREVKASGSLVGAIEADPASGSAIVPLAVPIRNGGGSFVGALFVRVLADPMIRNAVITYKKYETTQIKLLRADGTLIYSTKAYQLFEDVSQKVYFSRLKGDSGSFLATEGGRESLFSYAYDPGYLGFKGLGLILVIGHDVNEVLAPSFALRNGILAASAVLIVLGVIVALLLSASITRPVALLQQAAAAIARGDLDHDVRVAGTDELGMLARSFAEMKASLRSIAAMAERIATGDLTVSVEPRSEVDSLGSALKTMAATLQRQIREIQEGASVVASAASEISTSTSQFAATSTETSVAVSQTTATIEQVRQTVSLSNEKAKQVVERAKQTEEVAQTGLAAVRETGQMIGRIREQMEAVSESIGRLNEQNAAIGEITTTVSEMADQSKLLAVNAAIEAAKAGEQGKGFGVVAQEIKDLADQSKRATAQVRKILSDIQKATSAAVMTTDQGSRAVELGMKQAEEARGSIETLAETVEDAVQAAAQIAAQSQQQIAGMDQVATAMESIKAASLQSVAGTKQLETGALNIHGVGQRMKQLVEFYKV